ncbi:MAG: photosystem reaction center subunit H [Symploca sp. SIO3C6]|nr:photosystem reaction center subunit H [Symploca sp. SIO3C6]
MSKQLEALKQSELLNRLVLDRQTAEEIGRVAQLLLDPQAHRVVGLTCKSGFLGSKKKSFTWAQVEAIGTDSIMINGNQGETFAEKLEPLDSPIDCEVWTDSGNKVGRILDYLLEPNTGSVLNYLFSSNGWRGFIDGIYLLPPVAISSIGKKRVIVIDAVIQKSQPYTQGLNQKINQAAEYIEKDYKKTVEDLEAVGRGVQNVASQVKDKTQDVTSQIKDKAQAAGDTFKGKVSQIRTQLPGNSQTSAQQEDKES